jgi:Flp pilus assembly protein protease CpaA
MSKQTVAAHVAIACLAGIVGYAAYGLNRMGCFSVKQPFGSACSLFEDYVVFLQASLPVAVILYALWGVILLLQRANKTA